MRRVRTLSWIVVAGLLAPNAMAEGLLKTYTDFFDRIVDRVQELDIYGSTAQLPQGIFSFKWEWNNRRAAGRFTNHRVTTDMT